MEQALRFFSPVCVDRIGNGFQVCSGDGDAVKLEIISDCMRLRLCVLLAWLLSCSAFGLSCG